MKKIVLIFALLFLVGCSSETVNNSVEEPETAVIKLAPMEDTKAIDDYMKTTGFDLTDLVVEEMDIDGDGTPEMIYINAAGQALLLKEKNGSYVHFISEFSAEDMDVVIDKTHLTYMTEDKLQIVRITDSSFVTVFDSIIKTNEIVTADPYLSTIETITRTVENLEDLNELKLITKSGYTDEKGLVTPLKHIEETYTYNAETRTYEINTIDLSTHKSYVEIRNNKVYGDDDSLETFEQVMDASDLAGAILYYRDKRNAFIEGDREAFADGIIKNFKLITKRFQAKYDYFEAVEIDENEATIYFVRNDVQFEEKLQSVLGYFEAYELKEGTFETKATVKLKNKDLSEGLYYALLDATLIFDKGLYKKYMIHTEGLEGYDTTEIPVPNVLVSDNSVLSSTPGTKDAVFLKPLTLKNEPITLTNLKSVREGDRIDDLKVTYLKLEDDKFNINMMGKKEFQADLKFNPRTNEFVLVFNQEPVKHFYYDLPKGRTFFNYLSGETVILSHRRPYEESISEDLRTRAKAGEIIPVAGTIDLYFVTDWNEHELGVNVDITEIFELE